MVHSHFHLVKKILSEGFYTDISRSEIERSVYTNGEFDDEFEISVDDDGQDAVVVVRLVVHRGHKNIPETFTAAVLIHDTRVAGVDFEVRFTDWEGNRARGWHLHEWDDSARTSDHRKIPLKGFGNFSDLNGFLIRAMQALKNHPQWEGLWYSRTALQLGMACYLILASRPR